MKVFVKVKISTAVLKDIYIYIYIFTNLISTSIHGTRKKRKKKPSGTRDHFFSLLCKFKARWVFGEYKMALSPLAIVGVRLPDDPIR